MSGERWLWYNAEIRNWMVGTKDKIGSKTGTLSLADTCESPDRAAHSWKAWKDGDGWVEQPTLKCTAPASLPPPPPKYLRLDGGKDLAPDIAANYLGYYELEPGQRSHGRAVWKHASCERWLWYNAEISNWMVGTKDKIGSNLCHLFVSDTCESPDRVSHHWKALNDGSWVEQPTLKCTAPASIQQVKVGSCVEVISGSNAGRTGKVVEDDGTSNPYKVVANLHTAPHSIEATGPITPEPHELFLAGALC